MKMSHVKKMLVVLLGATVLAHAESHTIIGSITGAFQVQGSGWASVLFFVGIAVCSVDGDDVDPNTSWTYGVGQTSTKDTFSTWWWSSGTYSVSGASGYSKKNADGNVTQWGGTYGGSSSF